MTLDLQSETHSVLASRERTTAASSLSVSSMLPMLIAGPAVAVVTCVAALVATDAAGVPLRDPDGVAGNRLLLVVWMVLALVGLDILVRGVRRAPGRLPTPTSLRDVRRERWTASRGIAVGSALIAFYATYLAYRNLKSVVPLLRPGDIFDRQLGDIDRTMFLGHDPAALLHAAWGVGFPTQAMSFVYMLFFLFIPATLAAALVFSPDLRSGLFYATAQSLNWVLGAASYFLVPSLGPVYDKPGEFSGLPASEATHLQSILLDQRLQFLHDPAVATAQSIGAFASLHVSIFVTAALAAHVLGLGRRLKVLAWTLVALTALATIHLGWHYFADDLGGVAIAFLAIAGARVLTRFDARPVRRRMSAPSPSAR